MTLAIGPWRGAPAAWDDMALRAQGGTHCHRWGWMEVIRETFGHEAIPLAATEGDTLVGLLPLVRLRTALFGHYLVSMPFLNYGGPLGSSLAVEALINEATALGRAGRVKLLELRSRRELPTELPASRRKITVVLDLPASADALMKALPAKLRSQVRRPAREGVTVRFGEDQVAPFYQVFSRHMRDLGTPVLPRRFFEAMARQFRDDAWFACAWLGDRPVACGAGVVWRGESEMIWASSLREVSRLAPNMLLYWTAMEHAIDRGCQVFNFGRCTPGSGTHRFKQQWGGRDVPLCWYQDSSRGVSATPSPDGPGFGLAVRAWQRLPVPLATALGPMIVRGIP